jgi:hypothetical protein
MDKFTKHEQPVQYAKPAIKDYGTLQELTASGGKAFQDSPIGTPIGNVTASSTP